MVNFKIIVKIHRRQKSANRDFIFNQFSCNVTQNRLQIRHFEITFETLFQVVLSVFGDQPSNAIEAERRGYGLHIPLSDLTSENLLEAIKRILNEPIFTLRAKEHGQMVMDQMTTPFERAIWWIEYAIRYPKMRHMRSPVHDLHWTQLFLLDVIAFLLACLILTFVGFYLAFKFCCCRKSKQKKE